MVLPKSQKLYVTFENVAWFFSVCYHKMQLKETTERILAVDRAAAMIEEMMRQKPSSQLGVVGFHTVKVRIVSSC